MHKTFSSGRKFLPYNTSILMVQRLSNYQISTRHLALDTKQMENRFAYPAIISGKDDRIHVVYSVSIKDGNGGQKETICHAAIDEAWVIRGDE